MARPGLKRRTSCIQCEHSDHWATNLWQFLTAKLDLFLNLLGTMPEPTKQPLLLLAAQAWTHTSHKCHRRGKSIWSDQDSNLGPLAYRASTLTTELPSHTVDLWHILAKTEGVSKDLPCLWGLCIFYICVLKLFILTCIRECDIVDMFVDSKVMWRDTEFSTAILVTTVACYHSIDLCLEENTIVKIKKNSDMWKNCCLYRKIWTMWFYHRAMHPKHADGMANNVDSDQIAPEPDLSLHCLTRPICPKT